jgi:hypothetical protein
MQIDDTVRNLMAERNKIDGQIANLRAAKANVDRRLRAVLLENAGLERLSFRYGPTIVRVSPKYDLRARRNSEGAVFDWIADLAEYDGENVWRRLFNLNGIRWAQLRTVVDAVWQEVDFETGEITRGWKEFKRRYLDETEGDVEVRIIPEDKAPGFLQKLEDSEAIPA